jgi:predicted Fe-Mo cluster-binding NifX family protein
MKIVVSASGANLEALVDPRFGRCPCYIFVDTDTGTFEAQQNAAAMAGGGAGIQAAQAVVQSRAQAVITGNVGPNAFQVFSAAGVPVYTARGMSVLQAVEAFKAGTLPSAGGATGPSHAGMGGGGGSGMGAGSPAAPVPSNDVAALKQEVAELRKSVAALLQKIDDSSK